MSGDVEDIGSLGFEEALNELEKIVRSLESGDGKLDDARFVVSPKNASRPKLVKPHLRCVVFW